MNSLWLLLLPLAAASGWYVAYRDYQRKEKNIAGVSSDYIKGLNYLLNEQPDKAIEVFIRMVEVDDDTVETHLALGHLFRRRGEVDRAIRIHQNLIARPRLDSDIRTLALLELGEDYMKAGLFDRAENLFQELIDLNEHTARALAHLRDIYQQEQDWDKAIDSCRRLELITHKPMNYIIAQYYCEMSEKAFNENDLTGAQKLAQKALSIDKKCVRASILQAQVDSRNNNFTAAISSYKHVVKQDIEYFAEVIEPMLECYHKTGNEEDMIVFLQSIVENYNGISPMLALARLKREHGSDREAMDFVIEQLRQRPSVKGLNWLIELSLQHSQGDAKRNLMILYDLTHKLIEDKPVYECNICGFAGKSIHWQCPGCKKWNTVKPIHGVEGE